MKKTTKRGTKTPAKSKPAIAAAGGKPQRGKTAAVGRMGEAELARLLQSVADGTLSNLDIGDDDAESLFGRLLDFLTGAEVDGEEKLEDLVPDLISSLGSLQVDANGGDPSAREAIDDVLEMLDDAIDDEDLDSSGLLLVAKVFSDAGWTVPEALKQATVKSLEHDPLEAGEPGNAEDLIVAMLELAERVDDDEFELFEQIASMFDAFPAELASQFVGQLVEQGRGVLDRALVGFALHRDASIAVAALEALSRISTRTVESLLVERLVRMRAWTPPERHGALDAAVKALRQNAQSPVKSELHQVVKIHLSTSDGSGARSLLISTRKGRPHSTMAVLVKPNGVVDVMVLDGQSKVESERIAGALKSSTPTAETDVAALTRMLSICLADNLASGVPPPFRLVQLAERLGFGPIAPREASTDEIAGELLSALSAGATDAAAVARAYEAIGDSEVTSSWFEAGEKIEDLLAATKTRQQRVKKLLANYLPERKPYWARVAVLSALALRGPAGRKPAPYCLDLALIARDLASDRPVQEMPLMHQIAEATAEAFASHAMRR